MKGIFVLLAACVAPPSESGPGDTGRFVPFAAQPGNQLAGTFVTWIDTNGEIQSREWDEDHHREPPAGAWLEVSGWGVQCARDATHVECWDYLGDLGNEDWGQLEVPDVPFRKVAAGAQAVCGITGGDRLKCWGRLDAPPVETGVLDVAVGPYEEACLLTDAGFVECWGANLPTTVPFPPSGRYVSISVGAYIACVLDAAGHPTCWGETAETLPSPEFTFTQVSAGWFHACGVTTAGPIECWGSTYMDDRRELPEGEYFEVAVSEPTCGLTVDRTVACSWDEE